MRKNLSKAVLCMLVSLLVSFLAIAQDGEQQGAAQRHPMTFLRYKPLGPATAPISAV